MEPGERREKYESGETGRNGSEQTMIHDRCYLNKQKTHWKRRPAPAETHTGLTSEFHTEDLFTTQAHGKRLSPAVQNDKIPFLMSDIRCEVRVDCRDSLFVQGKYTPFKNRKKITQTPKAVLCVGLPWVLCKDSPPVENR